MPENKINNKDTLVLWLLERFGREGSEVTVTPASSGFSAESLFVDIGLKNCAPDARLVVRLENKGGEIFLDSDIANQEKVMTLLQHKGIPVPKILAMEKTGNLLGRRFFVMNRIEGKNFPQAPNYYTAGWVKELRPEQRTKLWNNALTIMGKINSLSGEDDFSFLNREQYGKPGLEQYLGWLKAWRNDIFEKALHPVIDEAFTFLEQSRPKDIPVNFIWGDSNPSNLLFSADGNVNAVLDFEAAALGPAEVDLGWWYFLDRSRAQGRELLSGVPNREECNRIYAKALGRDVVAMDYFEILGGVKMSLVIARTAKRLMESSLISTSSNVAMENPQVGALAGLIGLEAPLVGQDFSDFVSAVSTR